MELLRRELSELEKALESFQQYRAEASAALRLAFLTVSFDGLDSRSI